MLKFIISLAIFFVAFIAYVKYIESRSIFFPTKNIDITPADLNIPFQDVYLKTSDGVDINAWFIPFENAQATILFCHGNGGNVSHRTEKIILLRQAKINILIFDYRGYGNSKGKTTEKGIYQDALAAYDYLVKERNINPKDILVYGESLGCAVAIDLSSKRETGALILEGSFSSGKDMAKILYPFLPTALFFNKFNSLSKIEKVNEPKLFIHSRSDEIVPYDLAQKLFNAAPEPKQMVEIRGGHNTAFIDSQEDYTAAIVAFVKRLK